MLRDLRISLYVALATLIAFGSTTVRAQEAGGISSAPQDAIASNEDVVQVDSTPPELDSLAYSPTGVDVNGGDQTVDVTLQVRDDTALDWGYAGFVSPSGQRVAQSIGDWNRTSGDQQNGLYEAVVTVPEYAESGKWEIFVDLHDTSGNTASLTADDIAGMGYTATLDVQTDTSDVKAPSVEDISMMPGVVDVEDGPQAVSISIRLTDAPTGVMYGNLVFVSPSGSSESLRLDDSNRFSGDSLDGVYEGSVTIPQGAESGSWKASLYLRDNLGNAVSLGAGDLLAADLPYEVVVTSGTPATIGVSPSSLSISVEAGKQASAALAISNSGEADLNWGLSLRTDAESSAASARLSRRQSVQGTATRRPIHLQRLVQEAEREGNVRVLARLAGRFRPEGHLAAPAAAMQRSSIARRQREIVRDMAALGAETVGRFQYVPYVALQVDAGALRHLAARPDVEAVYRDEAMPPALGESTALVGADSAWARGFSGEGQAIAILDTGVDGDHPFLQGKVVSEACYSSDTDASVSLCPDGSEEQVGSGAAVNCDLDVNGCSHGTHVAGIAAGDGPEFSGVAKDASILAFQVFSEFDSTNCQGGGSCVRSYTSDQLKALERVYELRDSFATAAVNMSLGGGEYTQPCDDSSLKEIIDNLRSVGIATVISSGNDGFTSATGAPACISSAVSVGSVQDGSEGTFPDEVSSFSNSADFLDLLAPGERVASSVPGGGYGSYRGTSMAAPHVAGAWAVLKSDDAEASVDDVLSKLRATGAPVRDGRAGRVTPRIQINAALDFMPWLAASPGSGSTAPGGSQSLTVTVDAGSLDSGSYSGRLVLSSNDPSTPTITVPLDLTVTPPSVAFGDVSGDGEVSAYDASYVLRHTAGLLALEGDSSYAADVTGDGSISAYDASFVLRKAAGLVDCFPRESCSSTSVQVRRVEAGGRQRLTVGPERQDDSRTVLPLRIDGDTGRVYAVQINASFDGETHTFSEVDAQLPDGWQLLKHVEHDSLRIVLAGTAPLEREEFGRLVFERKGTSGTLAFQGRGVVNEQPARVLRKTAAAAASLPSELHLEPSYPNPTSGPATIAYHLPAHSHVRLLIFNMLGQHIQTLVDERLEPGSYEAQWNGRFEDGAPVPSGHYFYRLQTGTHALTRKMIVLR